MKRTPIFVVGIALVSLSVPACHPQHAEGEHHEHHKLVATNPKVKDVVITQEYVCQIRSRRHIEICALQDGYLEEIPVKEGQTVKQGDVLFTILPTLYRARYDAEVAEAKLVEIRFKNTKALFDKGVIAYPEVASAQAELDKAIAKVNQAKAELEFATVKAPFDGIVDRLHKQQGSLIEKKDPLLTTLSDNSVMWVYFNVPEARYLEYMKTRNQSHDSQQIELRLANGDKFPHTGTIGAIEAKFNNETGNIPFRVDFQNPDRLLRHGQTGTVLINRTVPNAIVIPQRATYEILDKRYVFVVGEDHVVHQRLITVKHEQDDIFVIESGISAADKIILEGVRQVHDGEKIEYELRNSDEALAHQKHHAE